jgi:hypothetical protein
VYAVWFNMYPGDARAKWPATALTDSRVQHRWDEARVLGLQYLVSVPTIMDRRAAETLPPTADAMWDAFFLYAPGDSWQNPLPVPVAWGYPIMVTKDDLSRQLDVLLAR